MGNYKKTKKLLVAADLKDSAAFANEKERIRYISNNYSDMGIGETFKKFYGLEDDIKTSSKVDDVLEIKLGSCYIATVKEVNKHGILFDMPEVKDEIICKENFSGCIDAVHNYLLTHNNQLVFEVREHNRGQYVVSVINGMYKLWKNAIEEAIYKKNAIEVHIDSLTRGGYLCHTPITTLQEFTGKNYTHNVFIPGSSIVLNIENDFERWIDQDIYAIPQKFIERKGYIENSVVASRKLLLQLKGNINLYEIYNRHLLTQSEAFKSEPEHLKGHVTGIINSGKKTGVFVELDGMYITGLMPVDKMDLVNFKPGDEITVYPAEFEVKEGQEPFVTNKKGDIIRCNTRVVFGLVG